MDHSTLLAEYLKLSWHLVRIVPGAKRPDSNDWNLRVLQHIPTDWLASGQGVGLCHAYSGTCAIDIDHLATAKSMLTWGFGVDLETYLDAPDAVQITSGRPGRAKLLYRMPLDFLGKLLVLPSHALTNVNGGHVLQFRCGTRRGTTVQDVLPPSIHPDTGKPYRWTGRGSWQKLPVIPDELLKIWLDLLDTRQRRPRGDLAAISLDDIESALGALNPDMGRDEWYRVGMALHSTGEDLYDLWDTWSSRGTKYKGEVETWTVWKSFHEHKEGITLSTLFWYARLAGWYGSIDPGSLLRDVGLPKPIPAVDTNAETVGAHDAVLQSPEGQEQALAYPPNAADSYEQLMQSARYLPPYNPDAALRFLAQAVGLPRTHADQLVREVARLTNLPVGSLKPDMTRMRKEAERLRDEKLRKHQGASLDFTWKSEDDRPKSHLENFRQLLQYHGVTLRYNEMTHEAECGAQDVQWSEDNWKNQQVTYIKDKMIEHDMPYERCKELMDAHAACNAYHPFREILRGLQWDRKSRWGEILRTIKVAKENEENKAVFLQKWLVSVVAAVCRERNQLPPRGVLVFVGNQHIGKTTWLRYLTPPGMFGEGLILQPGNKDSEKQALGKLVVEFGELEETFRAGRLGAIKAWISRGYDELRTPYAQSESTWPRRTVYAGTVNQRDFLQDITGNTRFWPIEVTGFDLDAMQRIHESGELYQFWKEVEYWFWAGKSWHLVAGEVQTLEEHNEQFRSINPLEALLRKKFLWDAPREQWQWMTGHDIYEEVDPDGRYRGSYRTMTAFLTLLTGQSSSTLRRIGKRVGRYWFVPPKMYQVFEGGKASGLEDQ